MTYQPNSMEARDIAYQLHSYTDARKHQQDGPLIIERGEGIHVYDNNGKRYIEGMAGDSVANYSVSLRRHEGTSVSEELVMFKGRHFDQSVILLCVRWYLAYNLSLRDLEEMMAERGLSVDHSTVHRWVVHFSPRLLERFNRRKRSVTGKWHMDETYRQSPRTMDVSLSGDRQRWRHRGVLPQ